MHNRSGYNQLTHSEHGEGGGICANEHAERMRRNRQIYSQVVDYLRSHRSKSWVHSVEISTAIGVEPLVMSNALEQQSRTVLRRNNAPTKCKSNTQALEYRLCDAMGGNEHWQVSNERIAKDSERMAAQLVANGYRSGMVHDV